MLLPFIQQPLRIAADVILAFLEIDAVSAGCPGEELAQLGRNIDIRERIKAFRFPAQIGDEVFLAEYRGSRFSSRAMRAASRGDLIRLTR